MNSGIYLAGMIAGFIYLSSKEKLMKIKRTWKKDIFITVSYFSIMMISVLSHPFVTNTFEPSKWTILYGTFMKHYLGISIAVVVLGMIAKWGSIFCALMSHKFAAFFGRLTYAYYLTHIFVLRLFFDGLNQPLEYTVWGTCVGFTLSIVFLGYIFSTILTVMVEIPFINLAKEALMPNNNMIEKKPKKR